MIKLLLYFVSLSWSKYYGKYVYSSKGAENASSNHATKTHAMKNWPQNAFMSQNYNVSDIVSIANDKQHAKNNSTPSKGNNYGLQLKQIFLYFHLKKGVLKQQCCLRYF